MRLSLAVLGVLLVASVDAAPTTKASPTGTGKTTTTTTTTTKSSTSTGRTTTISPRASFPTGIGRGH